MEKRLPLALLLSLAFVMWWSANFGPKPQGGSGDEGIVPSNGARGTSGPIGNQFGDPTGNGGLTPSVPSIGSAGVTPGVASVGTINDNPGIPVPFAGNGFVAELRTRGASLAWLDLPDFVPEKGSTESLRLLGDVDPNLNSFLQYDLEKRYQLHEVIWEHVVERTADGRQRVVFNWTAADGLRFTRTFTETGNRFTFDLDLTVTNDGEDSEGVINLVLRGPQGVVDEGFSSIASLPPTALAVVSSGGENEFEQWSGGDLEGGGTERRIGRDERLVASGTMTNYFTSVLVPSVDTFVRNILPSGVVDHVKLEREVQSRHPLDERDAEAMRRELALDHLSNATVSLLLETTRPKPGASVDFHFTVYVGPRDRHLAAEPGYDFLGEIIASSYGMSSHWINKSLLMILGFFYSVFSNWGVAIILLTVVVKAMLFPLNRIQQSSMAKYGAAMQKLKPQIEAMKEKYKNNKRKFNEEQMKLLKSNGVSPPIGGCLLMFLQFPIWIGLFQCLRSSIELRQGEFVGWINDLSQPDRMTELPFSILGNEHLNLLPLLMSAAMVAQMKFTPSAGDEQSRQMQKMMGIFMPIMMLFILYGYPSGLSLYILTSSLLGIFEFKVIRKFWPPPTADTIKLKPKTA